MKKFVCLTFILLLLCGFCLLVQNKAYNSVIVIVDQIKLKHGHILRKGDFAQLVVDKCTEEGMFIRTKNDSGLVYMKNVTDVVFLVKDIKVKEIESGQEVLIKKNTPLILKEIDKKKCKFTLNNKEYIVKANQVSFFNKDFYNSIIKK